MKDEYFGRLSTKSRSVRLSFKEQTHYPMKYYSKSFLLLLFLFLQFPQWTVAQSDATLRNRFLSPPEDADSWCFWYWMYGAVSKEGITADLEAMKHAGLGGTYLMPIKGIHEGAQYNGKAQQLTPVWWEMGRFSM